MSRSGRGSQDAERGGKDRFTHLDAEGRPRIVDVGGKADTERAAIAAGAVRMAASTLAEIASRQVAKGDVLAVAQVAGIMAAKRSWELIPLCHPLLLSAVEVSCSLDHEDDTVQIEATVRTTGKTGVEMEALAAVAAAALTVYDMCKALDRGMVIENIRLLRKSGGRSGLWERERRQE